MSDISTAEREHADFALACALTADGIYGLAPGYQVQPILDFMAERGWTFVQEDTVPPWMEKVWFHDAHGMHTDEHHQHHGGLVACVPLWMLIPTEDSDD